MGKRGLGKGLAALIADTSGGEQEGRVREVPVAQVTPNPYQPRTLFDPIKMEELVSSIKEHGILQPILLREIGHERFQIVAGERRFRAAQSAGLGIVPAIIKECNDRDLLEMAVVENVQRDDIGAMEAARAYRRMIDEFGMTQETVSVRVGKSRSSVANVLRLLDLPEFIQDSLERSEISEGHGKALLKLRDDSDALERAWQRTVQGQLSVRATEKVVEDLLSAAQFSARTSSAAPFPDKTDASSLVQSSGSLLPDPHEASMVEALQQRLGTKVSLHRGARGGRIEIEFYNQEELERLSEILLGQGDR